MKLQLLYQKVYFKSSEWKDLVNYIKSFDQNISVFLLSKNIFLNELKQVKNKFLGECVILEITFKEISVLFELMSKIQHKYSSRFFLIGFLFSSENKVYFLKIEQIKYYFSFFNDRKKNKSSLISFNTLIIYEFLKFLKLNEVNKSICMSFFKNIIYNNNFSYYY